MTSNKQIKEEALIEYLDECGEMLERFTKNLGKIEQDDKSPDILAAIYRDMHTVKGSSHLFGFNQVGELAHAIETCLDPVRRGQAEITPNLVDILYSSCDVIASLLVGIRETKVEPDRKSEIQSLIPRLIEMAERSITKSVPISPDKLPSEDVSKRPPVLKDGAARSDSSIQRQPAVSKSKEEAPSQPKSVNSVPGLVLFEDKTDQPNLAAAPAEGLVPPQEQQSEAIVLATPAQSKVPVNAAPVGLTSASSDTQRSSVDESQVETIRVQVSLLDSLMNLVGEQVLIRNQLLQHAKENDTDANLTKLSQRLNILTAELQNEVMKTRMQPVGNVLNKFSRVVRDMGRELGKKIDLNVFGAETELDKTIIEAIKDPLTHIVRNSVDHGIETPVERRSAGKSESGTLTIKAHHESGQVIIEIADDGRGLDPKKIGPKAVEKGVLTGESLARLNEREVQNLIFAPGFSTAATVSNISGRGVGMDVVKTNIERIGGLVDLNSVVGRGTTINFKIPLTLAIVPALIVRALGQRFAIPQSKLIELVLIDETNLTGERIEILQGSPVLRLRGKILPLLKLSDLLSVGGRFQEQKKSKTRSAGASAHSEPQTINVVVLNANGFQFGLMVDSVDDTADIVVKPLASFLKEISHFSGATIMGDGSVALTIDVMGISTAAMLSGGADGAATTSHLEPSRNSSQYHSDMADFLLVDVGAPASYAIPLAVVARLEELPVEEFDLSGEQKVVQYRDALLPIFSLPEYLDLPYSKEKKSLEKVPVVVIRRGENLYGIEVFEIRDVVSMPSKIDQTIRDRPGILGNMISGEDVLVVVDILGVIDSVKAKLVADSGLVHSQDAQDSNSKQFTARRQKRILIAEDSSFFRNYIRQVLEDAGFQTEVAADGAEGWSTLEASKSGHFSLILSDIEMPVMDGFELASKVSSDARFKALPLVAITTRFSNADIERGKDVGFTRYLEKLNAEKLITELDALLLRDAGKPRIDATSFEKGAKRGTTV